jgi:hypothetical protein
MERPIFRSTKLVGFTSAVLSTIFSLVYVVAQLAEWLIWIAALWAVTFPGSTWCLAILFRRAETTGAA